MKKRINFLLVILSFGFALFAGNFSYAKDYEYKNLDINADIKIDGTIDVTETFTVNFLKNKHGIIRFIPFDYTVGGDDFHVDLDYIRVDGNKFSTYIDDGGMNIKIGDPDVKVKGEKVYPISYSVYGLIRNFAGMGYSELYRNIVGYDFDTNINKIKADINLPKIYTGFTDEDFLITTDGNTITVSEFDGKVDWSKGDKIVITYDKKLDAGEGITLAIKFPKDYFEFDHDRQANLIGKSDIHSNVSDANGESTSLLMLISNFLSSSSYISNFLVSFILATVIVCILEILTRLGFIQESTDYRGETKDPSFTISYDKHKGFSGGSVFSGGLKFFKRRCGGGGGGSKSW